MDEKTQKHEKEHAARQPHFENIDEDTTAPQDHRNPFAKFFSPNVSKTKNEETLIDIHIGNPLRRIADLLEDIKKQKAFSFTLKGSLGIAGVALALSLFGILGGNRLLCDKGTQSIIGTVKILKTSDVDESPTILKKIKMMYQNLTSDTKTKIESKPRIILIKNDSTTIHLIGKLDLRKDISTQLVYATGQYDSYSQTLSITEESSVELYR